MTRRNGPQKKHKLLLRLHRPRRLRKRSVALRGRSQAAEALRSRRKRKMSKLRLTVERPRKKPQHQKDKPSVLRMQKHGRRNWMRMPQRSRPHWTPIGKPVSLANANGKPSKPHVKRRRKSDAPKPRHVLRASLSAQARQKMKPRRTTVKLWFLSDLRWRRKWKTSRMTPP